MLKNIFIWLILYSLTSCGYEPIHSKKDKSKILISDHKLVGNKILDRKIFSRLNLKKNKTDVGRYELILNSKKILDIVSKDKSGNTSIYRTTVGVDVSLKENNKIFKERNFISSFTYNNLDNKFDLLRYQKDVELNLINKISDEIVIFLNLLQ